MQDELFLTQLSLRALVMHRYKDTLDVILIKIVVVY